MLVLCTRERCNTPFHNCSDSQNKNRQCALRPIGKILRVYLIGKFTYVVALSCMNFAYRIAYANGAAALGYKRRGPGMQIELGTRNMTLNDTRCVMERRVRLIDLHLIVLCLNVLLANERRRMMMGVAMSEGCSSFNRVVRSTSSSSSSNGWTRDLVRVRQEPENRLQ